ncbi:MAG: LysM peptidoglycan-binding domain-containing protein [Gammaproteobacteria bacterium]|nr:LysM peptidoglycan-binding domain-containing protein [Gammaproteobacteria bacterium]MDH5799193.1 LysM peptidoglycan-binding domain-containing protein [Gammaproteobacteria bacterium]
MTQPVELSYRKKTHLLPFLLILAVCSPSWAKDKSLIDDESSVAPWVKLTPLNTGSDAASAFDEFQPKDEEFVQGTKNIWDRLRSSFQLSGYEQAKVEAQLNWYRKHPNYINRVANRATPFLHYILEEVEKRNMPAEIALLPVVESAFQPFAYSPGSAAGLWQFIAPTGKQYGLKLNWWYDGRRDVYLATQAALEFLIDLHDQFDNDWLLALAAYNSGQGTVRKAIRKNLQAGRPTDFWSLKLPRETRDYVPKLLGIAALVDDPASYNIKLKPIPDKPYFTRVPTKTQLDLALAADLAGMKVQELYSLNPAFNRWATAPEGPHYLLIPINRAQQFQRNLVTLNTQQRVQWKRHKIQAGDTLSSIAAKYNASVEAIEKTNNIGAQIRSGDSLVIPIAAKKFQRFGTRAGQHMALSKRSKVKYKVQTGDTLLAIANKFDVTVRDITKWNGVLPDDTIVPGETLLLRPNNYSMYGQNGAPIQRTKIVAPPSKATKRKIKYRVKSGDSLSRISQVFRVNIKDVRKWNSLSGTDYLQPGQNLTLFVDVTRFSEKI